MLLLAPLLTTGVLGISLQVCPEYCHKAGCHELDYKGIRAVINARSKWQTDVKYQIVR